MKTVWTGDDGAWHTTLRGRQVLADPRTNKGTAFSDEERRELDVTGLIPWGHSTLDGQVSRVYAQYQNQATDLARNVLLNEVRDRNEVLYYQLLTRYLTEMLPIVYTPTVGQAIEQYSHEYRRPRGIYLSVDHPEEIETSLRAPGLSPGEVDLVVATDAGAILGIGDWGVGGIGIAVGKLAVYTAAAGIDPNRALPIMLDVGTDRQSLLDDPLYIGNRRPRAGEAEYDRFLEAFVTAVGKLFPGALLHWEDIGVSNARRLLDRYRYQTLSFNDDIQGTGAVNLAAVLAAARATGVGLAEHRIVIFGAGTAGTGIADQLTAAMLADGLSEDQARTEVLGRRPDGPADRRDNGPRRSAAPVRTPGGRGGWMAARRHDRRHRARRGGTPGAPDDPDRHVHPGGCVHRARDQGHGGALCPAGDPADVEPDLAVRGGTRRPDPVDGRPRASGHRQPVPARRLPRRQVRDRPGQQRADLPGAGTRRHRRPGRPGDRQHAGRRGARGVRAC